MRKYRDLLDGPRISVISAEPDAGLARMARTITPSIRIAGPAALDELVARLCAASRATDAARPRTLDLHGHSTADTGELRLGDWVITTADPAVIAWARGLAARLPRLGVTALRLLACNTAISPAARETICVLADLLGVEVLGTRQLLYDAHHDTDGFLDRWAFLLVGARALRAAAGAVPREVWPRPLDLGALPTQALIPRPASVIVRVATPTATHEILQLIRRDAGARMPGALAAICELALPAAEPDTYHVADVLLDGAFVRFYPDGAAAPGVVYPVANPPRLRQVVDALPAANALPAAALSR